jgi:cell division protein ZapA (FtsZ GTPase activity inhibitor)
MQSVEVEIFGRRFRLRSDDPVRTNKVAAEINRQIDELSEHYDSLDFTKLLLLICLQQQEQVLTLGDKNRELSSDLERLNQMISMIITDV